jgi:uncharacterized protein (TIGR03067 family)
MRRYLSLALLLAVPAFLSGAEPAEKDKLEGVWLVVSVEMGGKKASPDDLKNGPDRLVLDKGKYKLFKGDMLVRGGSYKVDTGVTPHTILNVVEEGIGKGQMIEGIYEVKGDMMRACFDIEGKSRPKEFATEGKPGHVLVEYKRGK